MTSADPNLPIPYMQRTREYYHAIGYDTPYRWALKTSVPRQRTPATIGVCMRCGGIDDFF